MWTVPGSRRRRGSGAASAGPAARRPACSRRSARAGRPCRPGWRPRCRCRAGRRRPVPGSPCRCSAASRNSAGSGLPTTTSGLAGPAPCDSAATRLPLPGNGPRGDGMVASVLVATHRAPARIGHAAPRRAGPNRPRDRTPAPPPAGARRPGRPRSARPPRSRPRSAGAPTTSTGEPAGRSAASSSAAACAEVSTSSSRAGTPIAAQQRADLGGPAGRVVGHERDRRTTVHCGLDRRPAPRRPARCPGTPPRPDRR